MSADGLNGTAGFVDEDEWLDDDPAEAVGSHPPARSSAGQEELVEKAVAYAGFVTCAAPKSEQRVREALARKRFSQRVIEAAMARCREVGIVDDPALARALAEEGLGKGHAPRRIRQSLEMRGLPDEVIEEVLAHFSYSDEEAAAYALAAERAERLRGTEPEAAYRRILGFLARRGYAEATARKVARQALFNDREPQRSAER